MALANLSKHSASLRFKLANSFKIPQTSSLFISSTSESVPMGSQSSSSSALTQYGISVDSSAGTMADITTFSTLAPVRFG